MELISFYRLIFTNQQEFFIESDVKETDSFLKILTSAGVLGESAYIILQLKDGDPIHMRSDKLFSVQRVQKGIVGAQTKLWRLVK